MKKAWEKPTLEVLDVNETFLGKEGNRLDAAFDGGTPVESLTFGS